MKHSLLLVPVATLGVGVLFGHYLWPGANRVKAAVASGAAKTTSTSETSQEALSKDGSQSSGALLKALAAARNIPDKIKILCDHAAAHIYHEGHKDLTEFFKALPVEEFPQWAAILANSPAHLKGVLGDSFVTNWAEKNLPAALKWTETQPTQRGLRHAVLAVLAVRDSSKALAYARALPNSADREGALSSLAETLSNSQPTLALDILLAEPQSSRTDRFDGLFCKWAAMDPAAAAAAALGLPTSGPRRSAMRAVMNTWAAKDPSAAAAAAAALPNANQRKESLIAVGNVWMNQDAAATLRWARDHPVKGVADTIVPQSIGRLASQDPAAALTELNQLTPKLRASAIGSVAGNWSLTDFDGAMSWATSLSGKERLSALGEMADSVDTTNPTQREAFLKALPALGLMRLETLERIGQNWAQTDATAAAEWIRSLPESERRYVLENGDAMYYLTQNAASVAGDLYLEFAPGKITDYQFTSSVVNGMVSEDPEKALEWARQLPTAAARDVALPAVFTALSQEDGPGTLARAAAEADPALRQRLLNAAADGWAQAEPEAALKWAANGEGPERQTAFFRALQQTALEDPAAAATAFAESIPILTDDVKDRSAYAAGTVASALFEKDHHAGVEWINSLPAGPLQTRAAASIAATWCQEDPVAASVWIRELPAGETRDEATASLVDSIENSDPESAFTWARSLTDPDRRDDCLASSLNKWKAVDEPAARAALNAAPISAKQRKKLEESWK